MDKPPTEVHELTEQQKKARAYWLNSMTELQKIDEQLMQAATAFVEVEVLTGHKTAQGQPQTVKLYVPARPTDLAILVRSLQHKIRQLEIGLGALVDMIMQSRLPVLVDKGPDEEQLVTCTRDPELPSDAQPFIKAAKLHVEPSRLVLEEFWALSGQAAERQTSLLRRGLLSHGAQSHQNVGSSILKAN